MVLLDYFQIKHTRYLFFDIPETLRETERMIRSPTGLFPCMHIKYNNKDNTIIKVSDSLAIIETLSELFPSLPIWPKDFKSRAKARSIVSEMHSGFWGLRNHMCVNLALKRPSPLVVGEDAVKDIKRVCQIWEEQRSVVKGTSGDQGWLFGEFSAADAIYLLVATHSLEIDGSQYPLAREYYDMAMNHPIMQRARANAKLTYEKFDFHRYDDLFVGYVKDTL
ncbi:hypothetical protein HDU76_004224 [Blyttiomyces sp. JEL0837]|nr:hypothetical protein HDU76_004224 [Blyttiomyces sp. JEL0837]